MTRLADMTARLHPLLREGEAIAAALTPAAVALETATVDALEVQRAHRFDDALELEEAAALAALLDIAPEPWQNLALYRAWVHASREALLQGAVTRGAIEGFARRYAAAHSAATRIRVGPGQPDLVENPPRRATARPPGLAMAPLAQLPVEVTSLTDAPASFLLTGLAAGPEACPLLANLATGTGLLWRGRIAPGQQLALRAGEDGIATATLDGIDYSERLIGLTGFQPGKTWSPSQQATPAPAIRLRRGANTLWFLPVALHDAEGLDRFLLTLADLDLRQGRYDETAFDHALFDHPAAIQLLATWIENEPASIALDFHAALVRRPAAAAGSAEAERERLAGALDVGIQRLRAAGIRARVDTRPFAETQGATDRLAAVLPLRLREAGSSGGERLPEMTAHWGVTPFDGSTFG